MITIIPAIDLKGGRCVRLRQGRADEETVYDTDPAEAARRWVGEGATLLHVVDLDGAFEGHPVHLDAVERIVKAAGVPVELGGGLRTDADIERVLGIGVARAILGTRAARDPGAVAELAAKHGERLAVGIDARDGRVQIRGWVETTALRAVDLGGEMDRAGVKTLIYTDTSRDGMLGGVYAQAMGDLCRAVRCRVIASGGVSAPTDVAKLRALGCVNLEGVIVGKALYDGAVTLRALQAEG